MTEQDPNVRAFCVCVCVCVCVYTIHHIDYKILYYSTSSTMVKITDWHYQVVTRMWN